MLFLLTGCTSSRAGKEFGKAKVDGLITPCPGKINCPLPEEKKQGILAKLRGSGDPEAIKVADAIENGKIKMYEMNDAVREKYETYKGMGKDAIGLNIGNNIYIDPNVPDAVAAAHTAHEGTHVFDKSPNQTIADMLRREMKAFNKQADVWETLKKQDPSLNDIQNDAIVKHRNNGTLEDAVKQGHEKLPRLKLLL